MDDSLASQTFPRQQRVVLSKSYSTPTGQGDQQVRHRATLSTRTQPARTLNRAQSIKETLSTGMATFFGVPPKQGSVSSTDDNTELEKDMNKWKARRLRHVSRRYGAIRQSSIDTPAADDMSDFGVHLPISQEGLGLVVRDGEQSFDVDAGLSVPLGAMERQVSRESKAGSVIRVLQRRDSVAKMAWDRLNTLVTKGSLKPGRPHVASTVRCKRALSRSFSLNHDDASVFDSQSPQPVPSAGSESFDVLVVGVGMDEGTDTVPMETIAEEGADQALHGQAAQGEHFEDAIDGTQQLATHSRRNSVKEMASAVSSLQDDVFFDICPQPELPPVSAPVLTQQHSLMPRHRFHQYRVPPHGHHKHHAQLSSEQLQQQRYNQFPRPFEYPPVLKHRHHLEPVEPTPSLAQQEAYGYGTARGQPMAMGVYERVQPDRPQQLFSTDRVHGMRRLKRQKKVDDIERERWTFNNLISKALANGDRRRFGEGALGKLFGRTLKRKSELAPHVRKQLSDIDDYRPFFTYWVTTVQVFVLLITLCIYGFGPIGFGRHFRTANVLHSTVTLKQVDISEQENFWLGPKFSDLVHLGAKYSPCMRKDVNIYEKIEKESRIERNSACCIYNDQTGCFQSTEENCPELIATHHKWSREKPGPDDRISGSVCGQDPRWCEIPTSVYPYDWPDDITKWPICQKQANVSIGDLAHIECEITGKPCCIQLSGQCRITTRDYCDFVNGYFHEEATLCSQVSCLGEVCGMLPFFSSDRPDQFYRLFFSLFLHAGLLHVLLSVILQMWLMRDLEKLVGWRRLSLIYLCSGIAGNMASAIFVPYQAEVGPAGSQFGLLASLFVDAIYSWPMIVHPWKAILQLAAITAFLFLLGLLPWVDNWAHIFGFVFGLLLSLALFPYIQMSRQDRTKRLIIIGLSLAAVCGLFSLLILLFYVIPFSTCSFCQYFNCIPFTQHFCDNQGLTVDTWLPI